MARSVEFHYGKHVFTKALDIVEERVYRGHTFRGKKIVLFNYLESNSRGAYLLKFFIQVYIHLGWLENFSI